MKKFIFGFILLMLVSFSLPSDALTTIEKDMGFVSPFKKAKQVDNVLCNIMNEYVAKGCYNVAWSFNHTT